MAIKFQLGQCVATPGALKYLQEQGVNFASLLDRHVNGDWGDLSEDDKQANEDALIDQVSDSVCVQSST